MTVQEQNTAILQNIIAIAQEVLSERGNLLLSKRSTTFILSDVYSKLIDIYKFH